MRVLVTGASGFVGRNLVPYLFAEGHEVISASRVSSEVPSITETQSHGEAQSFFQVASVGPETDWSAALVSVDAVVHLAARAHVLKEDAADPLAEHRRVNTEGTRRLAEQALAAGVKRFVFVSSIGVLGNNSLKSKNGLSFTEQDDPNPHDDYSRSKWEAEQALHNIAGLETTIIRPPLIYGSGVPGNFRKLLNLARKGGPFPLGAVHNKRSLIGVRNLAAFIQLTLDSRKAANQTFVIADKEELSTAELYSKLCTLMQVKPRLLNVPESILRKTLNALGKGKMAERLCDTLLVDSTKAREVLGWKQPVSQIEGLKETMT